MRSAQQNVFLACGKCEYEWHEEPAPVAPKRAHHVGMVRVFRVAPE